MSEEKNDSKMTYVGTMDGKQRYIYGAGLGSPITNEADTSVNTSQIYSGQDGDVPTRTVIINGHEYVYALWGTDDQMPYRVRESIGDNMITAQAQLYNTQSCYGQGLRFYDRETKEVTTDEEMELWCMENSVSQLFLEQCVDMKFYYFCVAEFFVSRDREKIVRIVHKDACNCRFTTDLKHVLYGNFEEGTGQLDEKIEVIPRLDPLRPFADLMERTGRTPRAKTGIQKPTGETRFALVCSFPTVGMQHYPRQTFMSVFRDKWYDIYRLIGYGKREKIRNSSSPRYQIEIHMDYWDYVCDNENITDPEERLKRINKEKENIESFVCGLRNAGKTWITGYFVDPNGKENHMVQITNLESGKKEGGDWADDIQEASNVLCFAFGVHPNLIGATPGKTAMNNSGSDKRELFTLKQALDIPFRDMILPIYRMMLYYNGLHGKIGVDVPIVQLTTLDKGKDAKSRSFSNENQEEE